jgi:putative MATE family efflux protein
MVKGLLHKIQSWFLHFKEALAGKTEDFTKINIKRAIFLLSVPMILEMIMESLFSVVDIIFVGKLGDEAIATVGLTEAVVIIVYSIGVGISMAATALVARRFGEKDFSKAGSATFQLLIFGVFSALIIGVLGWFFAEDILILMGASDEVLRIGVTYTKIIFAGNIFIVLLFLINGAFRGAGQANLAMKTLWLSNGINLLLDPIFIFGLGSFEGMGLEGAAWATTIGRGIGVCYQFYHLLNGKHRLIILKENIRIRINTMRKIVQISASGMGQFLIDSVAWIALTRMVAEFGDEAVAGYTISFRILLFSLMPAWGFSAAAATLVGQNLGAEKIKRAELSVWLTTRYNVIFLGLVTIVYLVFGDYLMSLLSPNEVVNDIAALGLKITSLGYVFFGVGMVMIQAFNGAGDTRTPMFINIGVFWFLEIPLAYILAFEFNLEINGIFLAIAICHSLNALISLFFFKRGRWKTVTI